MGFLSFLISLEDNLTGLEIYLKDETAPDKEWYYIENDVDVFGIKNLCQVMP